MNNNKHSNIYITSAIYSGFTFLCIFITLISLVILHVFNPDKIPFGVLNSIVKLWAFVFVYFYFQYIICSIVIILFFAEKLIFKKNTQNKQENNPCLFIKLQHYLFLAAILSAIFINIIAVHMP